MDIIALANSSFFATMATKITNLRKDLLLIIGPLAGIALVISAIFWLVPGIDDDKKKTAKNIFLGVAIGLAVVVLAPTIISWIVDLMKVNNVNIGNYGY